MRRSTCRPSGRAVVRRSLIVLKALTYEPTGGIVAARDDVAAGVDRLRAQLGLPLLLAPRRDAHPARLPPGQPRGGGDRLATLAAARGRGRSGRHPDHVRRRRRAAADRVRAAVARRLRGLAAGAGRQRGERAAPARRLRRGSRRALPGARPRGRRSTRRRGGSSSPCSTTSRTRGASPTRASGRSAASGATSSTRRRWRGWRSTAPCGPSRNRVSTGRSTAGASVRDEIHREVCERGYDAKLGSFTQSYGSTELDASLLLLPLVGFLPADRPADPAARSRRSSASCCRTASCCATARSEAGVDGLPPGEGVFLPCSFWLANCYELLGRHDEARGALRAARSASRTTSASSRRSTTRRRSACSGTSRRRSRTSRSWARPSTSRRTCLRRCTCALPVGCILNAPAADDASR